MHPFGEMSARRQELGAALRRLRKNAGLSGEEMAAYRENIDAGEEVGIAVRSWHPDLAGLTEDFVLFDPGSEHQAMVWMRYDDQGQLTGRDYSDDPVDLARALRHREITLAHAVPLCEFVSLADTG